MAVSSDHAAWLRLTLVPGIGAETARKLLKAFAAPENIFTAGHTALATCIGTTLAQGLLEHDSAKEIDTALHWLAQPGNSLITLADDDYPQALLNSEDPPVLLYCKGRRELLNRPTIAIVGSRNASAQGLRDSESFAAALAEAGFIIASGLALGIDAAAHHGALKVNGDTIAVIGTGADRIYPPRNEDLARQIAEQGIIISDLPLGAPPMPANFPRRNRIIAGLARGCLVIEAAERSGSLITARLASEGGREVFAVPGSIHSPLHKGCHKLIKQGAKLAETAQDILDELRWPAATAFPGNVQSAPAAHLKAAEDDPVLRLMAHDPCDLDALCVQSGMPAEQLLAHLLTLELAGRISALPGGRYQRMN